MGLPYKGPTASNPQQAAAPRRELGPPPPEPVILPEGSCIADLRRVASEALSDMYRMFRSKAGGLPRIDVVGGLPPEVRAGSLARGWGGCHQR